MKWQKLLLPLCVLFVIGAGTVWADDVYEWYKAKEVRITINGEELSSKGLLVEDENGDSTTMLPLRDIADALQAMVKWDEASQTVHLYKPNVHIFLSTMNKDGSFGTFGRVYYKEKHNFIIFSQIDSLEADVSALKFEILDPNGNRVYEHEQTLDVKNENTIWVKSPNISLEFMHLGEYKVKLFMKPEGDDAYHLVSEKVFQSVSR